MQITCPHCSTVYEVPDAKMTSRQKLRCSACKTVWTFDPFSGTGKAGAEKQDPAERFPMLKDELKEYADFRFENEEEAGFDFNSLSEPLENGDLPEDFKIPEFKEPFAPVGLPDKNGWEEWSKTLFILTLACIGAAIWLFFFHPIRKIPLAFHSVSYEFIEQNYKKFLTIKASLRNDSDKFAYPRKFKVVFYSPNGRQLADRTVESPLSVLAAGQTGELEIRLERPPAQASKAELILDETDFADAADLPASVPEKAPTGRLKQMRPDVLIDGDENISPENGMQEDAYSRSEAGNAE